tara:strand:+ start:4099 stop:7749 length:3651 start_codon:yes stop_codon:yes gene_type:complete
MPAERSSSHNREILEATQMLMGFSASFKDLIRDLIGITDQGNKALKAKVQEAKDSANTVEGIVDLSNQKTDNIQSKDILSVDKSDEQPSLFTELLGIFKENFLTQKQVVQGISDVNDTLNNPKSYSALVKEGAPVNPFGAGSPPILGGTPPIIPSDRQNYEHPFTTIIKDVLKVLTNRLPKGGFWAKLLGATEEDDGPPVIGGDKGGGLLDMLMSGFGLFGKLLSIGTILGVIAAIGSIVAFIGAIITDKPLFSGLKALFEGIKIVGRFLWQIADFGITFGKHLLKTGSISKAFQATKAGTKLFPTLARFLTRIGTFVVDFVNLFLAPVVKFFGIGTKAMPKAGVFARLVPAFATRVIGSAGLRFLPLVGTIITFGFSLYRYSQGDWLGGTIDLMAGVLSLIADVMAIAGTASAPFSFGAGAAVGWSVFALLNVMSLGLSVLNFYLDYKAGGMTKTMDGSDINSKKAGILFDMAKKAIGAQVLLVLGGVFGPLFNVVDGLKLMAQGDFILGLKKMASFDMRFGEVLDFLGMEPEDIGLTESDVKGTQTGVNIGKALGKEAIKAALMYTPLMPILMFAQGLHTLAKGGSPTDALIEMSHLLPGMKYILDLLGVESQAPKMEDVQTIDYAKNIQDLVGSAFETIFIKPLLNMIDGVVIGFAYMIKWNIMVKEWVGTVYDAIIDGIDDLRTWIGDSIKGWWIATGKGWYDKFASYFKGEMTDKEEAEFALELNTMAVKIRDDFTKWVGDKHIAIKKWYSTWDPLKPFRDFWDGITEHTNEVLTDQLAKIIVRLDKIGDKFYKIIHGKSPGFLNDVVQAFEDAFDRAKATVIEGIGVRIDKLTASVDGFLENVTNDIISMIETPEKEINKFRISFNQSITTMGKDFSDTIDRFTKKVGKGFDDIVKCIESEIPHIVDFACKMAAAVRQFFDKTLGRVEDIFGILESDAPTADKINSLYQKMPKPEVFERGVEGMSGTADWIVRTGDKMSEGAKSLYEAGANLFKRSPELWKKIDAAGDSMGTGANLLVDSSKEFLANTKLMSDRDVPNVSRDVIDGFNMLQNVMGEMQFTLSEQLGLLSPEEITAPAVNAISTALEQINTIGSILGANVSEIAGIINRQVEQSMNQIDTLISAPQQVSVQGLKTIDITINEDQFGKLIESQNNTFEVLDGKILQVLNDINDSIENIQTVGGGLVPAPQGGFNQGEAINAGRTDRLIQRRA